jgi:hypothetical protein
MKDKGLNTKGNANNYNNQSIPDQPALFITTQTTIPQLTALMFAFSLAMLAFATSAEWPDTSLLIGITTKNFAFALLGVSAFLFIIATTSCVKSHAWDYWTLSKERRDDDGLSDDVNYKQRCKKRSHAWHRIAVWSYNSGFILVILSVSLLFWPVSKITSITFFIGLGLIIIIKFIVMLRPDFAERFAERFST